MKILQTIKQRHSRGIIIGFVIPWKDAEKAERLIDKVKADRDYNIEIKDSSRRSLNANSYHWVLVTKIAEATNTSNAEIHNQLLADYGEDWLDDSGQRTYVMMKDDDSYRRMETMHYRPTDHTEDRNGVLYRWFVLLLPSHLMSRPQMQRLIQGTISEAAALGIDTRTPEEIARMISLWGDDDGDKETRSSDSRG